MTLTRESIEAQAWLGEQRAEVVALLNERDALRAERDEAYASIHNVTDRLADAHDELARARLREARLREALEDLIGAVVRHPPASAEEDGFREAARAALAATDSAQWLAEHDARVRTSAFRSCAIEVRASIACAKRDGDALDIDWCEAAAETMEAYADGDGAPDDERSFRLLEECATPKPAEPARVCLVHGTAACAHDEPARVCATCGHSFDAHSGHTVALGQRPPTHCSQGCGCRAFAAVLGDGGR